MNKLINGFKNYFPATKSEIYAILIIVSGLLISLFNDFYHGEIITQKVRTEIVQASDSLALIEKKIKGEILININTASIEDLKLLKGIGEKTANKILVYRNEHKLNKKEDLLEIKGIGPKKLKQIIDFIEIDSTKSNK